MGRTSEADHTAPAVSMSLLAIGFNPLIYMFVFWSGHPVGLAGFRSGEDDQSGLGRAAPGCAEAVAAVCSHSGGAVDRQIG